MRNFLIYLNCAFKKFVFMGDPDLSKSRCQSRIKHVRHSLVKDLCRIKEGKQKKVKRVFMVIRSEPGERKARKEV